MIHLVNKHTIILLLLLCCEVLASGQKLSDQLLADIEDGELDNFSRIEAAFLIAANNDSAQWQQGLMWFHGLVEDVRQKNIIGFDKVPSAEKLFLYLHTTWLIHYQREATTLFDIMERKAFNCVSATVLYNLLGDEVGLKTEAFETPTHVYSIFTNIAEQVMVENTNSMGFNIMKNLQRYSEYLRQYYPENEALKIGLDRLYAYENSHGRRINNTELLGLIAYNLAIFWAEKKNFEQAYAKLTLAQRFNADSRSNQKFEISLYYRWGQMLFDQRDFLRAFRVMADACYRYPDNNDFRQNCQIAFVNALQQLWRDKDWDETEAIIWEMADLNIASKRELELQLQVLQRWMDYLRLQQRSEETQRAAMLYQQLNRP
ncbi:MAG: hypothetical protein ONB16_04220 [candidate division KSB1 bacterium]|nr:hypothetical protein [candidate division KSB1 bacterium]MDZ7318516.1 hypothetical protein [candidate division KSB1 bacterium]MDZ7341783.1 hypothetical protein [candidate division KSB1 bacterium]